MVLHSRNRSLSPGLLKLVQVALWGFLMCAWAYKKTFDKHVHLTEAQILLDYKSFKTCYKVQRNFGLLQIKESKIHINVKAKVCSSGTILPHLPQGSMLILGCPSHTRRYQLPDRKYRRHLCFFTD